MENQQLLKIVNRFPHLEFENLGSFPADLRPGFSRSNTFCIVNTDPSNQPGSLWILHANEYGKLFNGGSIIEKSNKYASLQNRTLFQ